MRKYLPALSLILIAPLVAEILPGSAPITHPTLLPFIVLIYGPGALLIRDATRARSLGWTSILLLGSAYGVLEEGIALQSLFNPVLYNAASWGRLGSVNVVYAEAVIPIHAIWSAAVPILLTDLFFSQQRSTPYLGRVGRILTAFWYLLGLALLALLTRFSIAPGYWAKQSLITGSAALALALIVVAFLLSRTRSSPTCNKVPVPLTIFWGSAAIAFVWHFLVAGLWRVKPQFAAWPLMLVPLLFAGAMLLSAYRYLSSRVTSNFWTVQHWLSLAAGMVISHTLFGILVFGHSWSNRVATLALAFVFLTALYARTKKAISSRLQYP
jgi:hypothetical protein